MQEKIINVIINENDYILSPFSDKNPLISRQLAEYLEDNIDYKLLNKKIVLKIICCEENMNNLDIYRFAIKNTYQRKYHNTKKQINQLMVIAIIMFLIGVIILSFALVLDYLDKNILLFEVYDIIAWVFIWEAVDVFFFRRLLLIYKNRWNKLLMESTIEFHNETIDN